MGVGIHVRIEKRDNGVWVAAQRLTVDNSWRSDPRYEVIPEDEVNLGNSALTASILVGGARNKHELVPISAPKGLPSDASPEVRNMATQDRAEHHSHTYFTVRELLDYDWNGQSIPESGYVSKEDLPTVLAGGVPRCWRYGPEKEYTEAASWREPVGSRIRLTGILPGLQKYGEPEDVRLVIWFDN